MHNAHTENSIKYIERELHIIRNSQQLLLLFNIFIVVCVFNSGSFVLIDLTCFFLPSWSTTSNAMHTRFLSRVLYRCHSLINDIKTTIFDVNHVPVDCISQVELNFARNTEETMHNIQCTRYKIHRPIWTQYIILYV